MVGFPTWGNLLRDIAFWGPGAVIAVIIILVAGRGISRIFTTLGGEFIRAQQALAEATGKQAQAMEGLRDCVTGFVARDSTEHKEILVLLKYIAQHQEFFLKTCREHEACGYCKGSSREVPF